MEPSNVQPVDIVHELQQSYLDYAMSVIVGRALPDVRDGLKPVHRRILYAMQELGNAWNRPYKKSARVVGDVIGKYHPHGDGPVYDTMVRMAQPFSMRVALVDGQGNFGSVDGDPPAAMRYTEARLSKIAHSLMADLDKDTVNFVPNYDGTERAPEVFPTRIPNLLINGTSGIAVGMATQIPTHNVGEVIDACLQVLDDPDVTVDTLMGSVLGPDFPTAALLYGRRGLQEAYRTGRGRVVVRARTHVETDDKSGKTSIVATELPFQVNKARLIEKIAQLVKDKKVEGITALRDESDKEGLRVVIEVRRGENVDVLLNHLFAQTPLEVAFHFNMVALVNGRPQLLSLKAILEAFLEHRREVITRRTLFERRRASERAHVVEGLAVALSHLDELIRIIKQARDPAEAKQQLLQHTWTPGFVAQLHQRVGAMQRVMWPDAGSSWGITPEGYRFSPGQAQAILDLRLHRLTGLEQDKIRKEYMDLWDAMERLTAILESTEVLKGVVREELEAARASFATPRLTAIVPDIKEGSWEDFVVPEDVLVTLSHTGYVKYQALDAYQAQHRGGRGKAATAIRAEDCVTKLVLANTHDTLLCFSNRGRVYWLKVFQLPAPEGRGARGKPIVNLLPLQPNEGITAILPVPKDKALADAHVFMATQQGTVKRCALSEFSRPRAGGIIAIDLSEDDALVGVDCTSGDAELMLVSDQGKVVRFSEQDVRVMGRTAHGVRGIRLPEGARVIALTRVESDADLLTATAHGFGKRTRMASHTLHKRGGQGVIAIQTTRRNGAVVGALPVHPGDEVVLISDQGKLVRTRVDEISQLSRATQGVRLIRLEQGEKLVGIARVMDTLTPVL